MSDKTAKEIMQASIAQSMEIAVQDAVDTLRNISTMETTVIGVASAKWLAEPANVAYKEIIDNATQNITFAAENLAKVGETASELLNKF